MPVIFKKYGEIVEITEIEKNPSPVRVYRTGQRPDVIGARRTDNLRRTKAICVRRLLSAIEEFGSPLLFTLTLSDHSTDAAFASDSLRAFRVRLQTYFKGAQSLFVPELSPRNRIHFHGLVFGVPMHYGDTRKGGRSIEFGEERKTRLFQDLWGRGFVDVTKTDGNRKLAYYLAKYVTKAGGEPLFNGMTLLSTSKGFPKEIVIRGDFAQFLRDRYLKKEPFDEWSYDSKFLGHINRKKYDLSP